MTIVKKLPKSAFYDIKARDNFYKAMRGDVTLLQENCSYTTCTTLVLCCLDALAAGSGSVTRGKFVQFVECHFPQLCADLKATVGSPKSGAEVLYENYRNGFAHLRAPKPGFAIANDDELDGKYAGRLHFEGHREFVAINVDRLIDDFVKLTQRLETETV